MSFCQGMEALLDGRSGREESVNDLFFGEQKGYVRIRGLGIGSCLTSVPIMSRHNLNGSTPGPLTWKLGGEISHCLSFRAGSAQ